MRSASMEGILDKQKSCSIIIVTYNSSSTIRACLASLVHRSDVEVVIVDNHSNDGTVTQLKGEFPSVTLIALQENIGFGRACNKGVAASQGDLIFFLNPDAVASPTAIDTICQFLNKRPDVGIAGARLVSPDRQPLASTGDYPSFWRLIVDKPIALVATRVGSSGAVRTILGNISTKYALPSQPVSVSWVSGAALCCRRSTWNEIGGFDEKFFLYYEDVDLCLRTSQAGWGVWHVPDAVVEHQSGTSFGGDLYEQKKIYYANQCYFFRKHFGPLTAGILLLFQGLYARFTLYRQFGTDRIGRTLT